MGQVLWTGVAANARPTREKRIEDTELIPVVLDLVTPEDITQYKSGRHWQVRRARIVRLFRQAYEQGAVLSQADVSLLTHIHSNTVSFHVRKYQQETGESIPSRGTIHDLGRSVTHKAIICYKSVVEQAYQPGCRLQTETVPLLQPRWHRLSGCRANRSGWWYRWVGGASPGSGRGDDAELKTFSTLAV